MKCFCVSNSKLNLTKMILIVKNSFIFKSVVEFLKYEKYEKCDFASKVDRKHFNNEIKIFLFFSI